MIEEVKKILRTALWMAYCSGRAGNEYIPEEVLPDLMKRCQLFEPKPNPIPEGAIPEIQRDKDGNELLVGYWSSEPKGDDEGLLTQKAVDDEDAKGIIEGDIVPYLKAQRDLTREEYQERIEGEIVKVFKEADLRFLISDGNHEGYRTSLVQGIEQALKEGVK